MKIYFDLHTHTRYSHGKGTVFDNANVALEQGISLGIADHGPGHVFFGVRENGMRRMRADIAAFRQRDTGISIWQGIEANLMDAKGRTDLDEIALPDYALMGFHKGIFPKSALSVSLFARAHAQKDRAAHILTDALIAAIDRYPIAAITHPGEYIPIEIGALAAACAALGVLIELNEKHPMPVAHARVALDEGACFLISSDAHRPEAVGAVGRAIAVAKEAGIPDARIANAHTGEKCRNCRLSRTLTHILNE